MVCSIKNNLGGREGTDGLSSIKNNLGGKGLKYFLNRWVRIMIDLYVDADSEQWNYIV